MSSTGEWQFSPVNELEALVVENLAVEGVKGWYGCCFLSMAKEGMDGEVEAEDGSLRFEEKRDVNL